MSTSTGSEENDYPRRRFLGTAAISVAAAQLGMFAAAKAQSSNAKAVGATMVQPGTHTSFGPLKQIDAGRAGRPRRGPG